MNEIVVCMDVKVPVGNVEKAEALLMDFKASFWDPEAFKMLVNARGDIVVNVADDASQDFDSLMDLASTWFSKKGRYGMIGHWISEEDGERTRLESTAKGDVVSTQIGWLEKLSVENIRTLEEIARAKGMLKE